MLRKAKTKKKDKAFYCLHPDLCYVKYADSKQLDRNATNIGYKSTLESLMKTGNRTCRKQAKCQETLFATRNDPSSEFGKKYKKYWDLRDSKAEEPIVNYTTRQLQQIASKNTINLARIAWGSIQTQTQTALTMNSSEASTTTAPSTNINLSETSKSTTVSPSASTNLSNSSDSTTTPSSTYVDSHTNNDSTDEVFREFFHDIKEVIDYNLDGIIDWTVEAVRELVEDKFPSNTFIALQGLCQSKEYEYTIECESLVNRLSGEEMSVMGLRQELLNSHEFTNKQFDFLKNQDWAYVKFISEHFVRLMECGVNPLTSPLAERTAASYTIQPIFNHLLLPYSHLLNMKWIEVSNDFTESAKLDGLADLKELREIVLIIEFAGGNISSSTAKYDSDIRKVYENALKSIKKTRRNKIFTVLYFNNVVYYESLLIFKQQYVRYNYVISRCPTNPPELQKFVKDTKNVFAWARDLVISAKAIV